jgi:hypothetical protein
MNHLYPHTPTQINPVSDRMFHEKKKKLTSFLYTNK